jgi:hypothetical protein
LDVLDTGAGGVFAGFGIVVVDVGRAGGGRRLEEDAMAMGMGDDDGGGGDWESIQRVLGARHCGGVGVI